MHKSVFLFITFYITTSTSMNNSITQEVFLARMRNTFPQEIWWHIGTFLNGNDKALGFILQLLHINDKQAVELIKRYIALEKKEPLTFFSKLNIQRNYLQIEKAWDMANNIIAHIEENICLNNLTGVTVQLNNEYSQLLIPQLQSADRALMNTKELHTTLENISYALYTIKYFEKIIKNARRRQAYSNRIPSITDLNRRNICQMILVAMQIDTYIVSRYNRAIQQCRYQKQQSCFEMSYTNCLIDRTPNIQLCTHEEELNRNYNDCISESWDPFNQIIIVNALLIIIPLTIYFTKYLLRPAHDIEENMETLIKRYKDDLIAAKNFIAAKLSTHF
jgi:hypothetical protein